MSRIAIFTAGNKEAKEHLESSIINPVDKNIVLSSFPDEQHNVLNRIHDEENGFYAWGAIPGSKNNATWESLRENDWVLCVYGKEYRFVSRVKAKFKNYECAKCIWGDDGKGNTWQMMYFLTRPMQPTNGSIPTENLSGYLHKWYMGFTKIGSEKLELIENHFGSVDDFINKKFFSGEELIPPGQVHDGFRPSDKVSILKPNDVLTNNELMKLFGVGQQGGMRYSKKNHHLVLISDATKGLYDDRWEGNVLHYTGEGKTGDQKLNGQNRRLKNSNTTGEKVHLFEVFIPGKYVYVGEVELANKPYQEQQIDDNGKERKVFMFPLEILIGGEKPQPSIHSLDKIREGRQKRLSLLNLDDLRKRSKNASGKPSMRKTTGIQYSRNEDVVAYVKKAAKGVCDLCERNAPFNNKDGQPYLECHHVQQLSKGGEDANSNAVALCPNCHRKMHSLNLVADRSKLYLKIESRDQLII